MQDDEVRKELTLRVEPERAWELVSEPEHLEEWFAHEVELDPQEGGEVRVTGHDGIERDGTVEVVDAPRTIRFVWWQVPDGEPSRVEIALRPVEGHELSRDWPCTCKSIVSPIRPKTIVCSPTLSPTRMAW